ncbi:hypothetical protein ACFQVD_26455 [Streptosporangium amethystogenes subsp. fukuiense]|uniref:Tail assembly chaperone n=1 Tax=Streptosporangium amethystogenes subsp. fukuiense TaxID=698418 RepID=A0ABW2T4P6_9ACTN
MAAKTSAIADIIGQVKRPEKTVPICLAGDMQAEFEDLERDLAIARDKPAEGTLAGGSNPIATTIAQKIVELRERMREHTTVFRFRGLPRRAWSDLVAECPPAEGAEESGADVDWETFAVALVATCAVEPQMSVDEAGQLAEVLTQAQWDSLFTAAYSVNKRDVDVPFSYAASAVLQSSKKNSR